MRKILSVLSILFLLTSNSWATVGWNKSIPATSENPQAISPDVIENNTAVDLMLQNYRDGKVSITLISTAEIDIGAGGVMLSNSGGSVRLMVANTSVTAVNSTMIDTGTISASATYYLYAYASSVTATTFSVIFSTSATSPSGITYYQRLGNFTTDSSKNFSGVASDVQAPTSFSLGTAWSANTPYQNTSGRTIEITAYGETANYAGWNDIGMYSSIGPTSSVGTKTAEFQVCNGGSTSAGGTITFKVPSSYWWEVATANPWISCGGANGPGSVNRIEVWQE
jgi:hypothetical protein